MEYNSIHKFDNPDDANRFIFAIARAGFRYIGNPKEGGVTYTNGKHEMLVCIG